MANPVRRGPGKRQVPDGRPIRGQILYSEYIAWERQEPHEESQKEWHLVC